jgi:amino acid transporter
MSLIDKILGRPLASSEASEHRLTTLAGIPTFGLDALSSAAYGPEAALTVLLPLGVLGPAYILPITVAIVVLLGLVFLSYRQTIAAYPNGGGSYTVARANLGPRAGLVAGAALMTDYVLTVAVGISAGVGGIVSAVPSLHPYTLDMCLVILAVLTLVNLRGISEAGVLLMLPTCVFVLTLFTLIVWGAYSAIWSGGHPHPLIVPPHPSGAVTTAGWWIMLRAFASGCTAMTGVEAVSNGVQAFQEPRVPAARRTLTAIIGILMILLIGIAFLAHLYGIAATAPGTPQYQSILSQLAGAVAGKGFFYWITMISIVLVLCLSANTSFADFPRLCRAIAETEYLPRSLANSSRRLVYAEGIWLLAIVAAILLTAFGGVTDRLIPLYAVGAFLAFTLSQAGMVAHWWKSKEPGVWGSIGVNGLGASATAGTLVVVATVKFMAGAWIVMLLVPSLVIIMLAVNHHYRKIRRQLSTGTTLNPNGLQEPIVIVPVAEWNSIAEQALRFALTMSCEIEVVHVEDEYEDDSLQRDWPKLVEQPAREAKQPVPKLKVLKSPFRFVVQPIVDYVREVERQNPDRTVAVLVPQLVEPRWWNYFLHNQRGAVLSARLAQDDRRVVIVTVPWCIRE